MNDRLNAVVERLLLDDRFLRRFRQNPDRALEAFDLTREEADAVKRGNAEQLIGLGLDPSYVWPQERDGFLHAWLVRHAKRLTPAVLLAAFLLPATPAVGARRATARRGSVRAARRYQVRALSKRAMRSEKVRRIHRAASRSAARY